MKLGASQSHGQSDATNIIPCLGQVTYTTMAASRRARTRWAVDAEPWDLGGQGQGRFWLRQETAGGGAVAWSRRFWRCALLDMVVDVPVVQIVDVGVLFWTRLLSCPLLCMLFSSC